MIVVIDGVEYIPAKNCIANSMAIIKGLLFGFWGSCSNEQTIEFIANGDIYVDVNDEGEGIPLMDVINNIAKEAEE